MVKKKPEFRFKPENSHAWWEFLGGPVFCEVCPLGTSNNWSRTRCVCVIHLGFSTMSTRFEPWISWTVCVAQTQWLEVYSGLPEFNSLHRQGRLWFFLGHTCLVWWLVPPPQKYQLSNILIKDLQYPWLPRWKKNYLNIILKFSKPSTSATFYIAYFTALHALGSWLAANAICCCWGDFYEWICAIRDASSASQETHLSKVYWIL